MKKISKKELKSKTSLLRHSRLSGIFLIAVIPTCSESFLKRDSGQARMTQKGKDCGQAAMTMDVRCGDSYEFISNFELLTKRG